MNHYGDDIARTVDVLRMVRRTRWGGAGGLGETGAESLRTFITPGASAEATKQGRPIERPSACKTRCLANQLRAGPGREGDVTDEFCTIIP